MTSEALSGTAGARHHLGEEIAQLLLQRGQIDALGLDRARRLAVETGDPVDRVIPQLGLVSERDLAQAMADRLELELVSPCSFPDGALLDEKVSLRFLRQHGILPLAETPEGIVVAMSDPLDGVACSALQLACGRPVIVKAAVPAEIEGALERLEANAGAGVTGIEGAGEVAADALETDVERLKDLASEAPVIRLVNQMIARAVEAQASDIHIEPFEDRLRVRFRIDGSLQDVDAPPASLRAAVISRIKILARLNIAERRLPQDGRIKLVVRGRSIDLRVSTMPSLYGESVVLRVLDAKGDVTDFGSLGFEEGLAARFLQVLERPNGIFLVSGPTGSGKTTTLYAALRHLNGADRKIVTVEDPVEYQLDGTVQIQVKASIGLDFATVLRSTLRHDPDVILVGEIRDRETAQVAVQAALTGHLVLSTLHTNTAAAAIARLIDMGIEDYLLASVLNGVAGQRLVRRLCPHCCEPELAPDDLVRRLRLDRFKQEPLLLSKPRGCPECRGTGFSGRTSLVEVLAMSESIRQMIMRQVPAAEIQAAAVAEGMVTMMEHGLSKAVRGITTLEEVMRVTRDV